MIGECHTSNSSFIINLFDLSTDASCQLQINKRAGSLNGLLRVIKQSRFCLRDSENVFMLY